LEEFKQAAVNDTELQQLRRQIEDGTLTDPWKVVDGFVLFQQRLFVPKTSPMLPMILSMRGSNALCIACAGTSMFQRLGGLSKTLFVPV
jgi:hypothetical protein